MESAETGAGGGMIRFVEIESWLFGFYDTVTDRFVTLADSQSWMSHEELADDWYDTNEPKPNLDRLIRLLPLRIPKRAKDEY